MNISSPNTRNCATTIGRSLMGLLFIWTGITMIYSGPAATIYYFSSLGIPAPELTIWVVVTLKIVAGLMLVLGYHARAAAIALIAFTAGATLYAHADPSDTGLFKNIALIGGLLYVFAYGPGDGWKV